ncbi:MAG: amidohydrolase family protein [Gemmatimonadota bacterium]|nr:amidohydrolase family protein [Gemmatimonadota bacterium]MDH5804095.1 amidohydrolase family protein [Gemmatimonadota bacterium]
MNRFVFIAAVMVLLPSCSGRSDETSIAFVGGTVFDGANPFAVTNSTIVVENGRIVAIGTDVDIPAGARIIDISGRYVIPGMVNAHAHVGDTEGLEGGHYSEANVVRDLQRFASYGITTVVSLGGDQQGSVNIRNSQADNIELNYARLFLAGAVVTGDTPEVATAIVDSNVRMGVDYIKFRVDDNLGTVEKMTPDVYRAIIERAEEHGIPPVAHLFYLNDAKDLLEAGIRLVAHSVRDRAVDSEFIQMMKRQDVCYVPTMMREVSTFVYEDEPDFFTDPFFLRYADETVLEQLRDPERQAEIRANPLSQGYKAALDVALDNVKTLSDSGVSIAMGTDTGPPGRFQGYFAHLELGLMARAGMNNEDILIAATSVAARCMGLTDVGTLEPGKWADLVILESDPFEDITNTRSIESVWLAGNRVGG